MLHLIYWAVAEVLQAVARLWVNLSLTFRLKKFVFLFECDVMRCSVFVFSHFFKSVLVFVCSGLLQRCRSAAGRTVSHHVSGHPVWVTHNPCPDRVSSAQRSFLQRKRVRQPETENGNANSEKRQTVKIFFFSGRRSAVVHYSRYKKHKNKSFVEDSPSALYI